MASEAGVFPCIRPLEAFPIEGEEPGTIGLRDRSGLAPGVLMVSEPVVFILSQCDGAHDLGQIRAAFEAHYGQALPESTLLEVLSSASSAHLLDDAGFAAYYHGLLADYQDSPVRRMRNPEELGIDPQIAGTLDDWMDRFDGAAPSPGERIVGLIAPHLDYPRGGPCYGAAYGRLRRRPPPERIVILGTNHFGRSTTVVATGKDFETPLGRTPADAAFIGALEARCGELRRHEFDHLREHSVELQVLWCQHLFGADAFKIVPVLCPDPCGPTGTRPYDGQGIDLTDFARALGDCVAADTADTLIIAGADLSHIGAHFGDDRRLDEAFLPEVRERDERALRALEDHGAEAFRLAVAEDDNPTRVCSAGCIFALRTALPRAKARLLRYHQAVDEASQTGVTCAAVELME